MNVKFLRLEYITVIIAAAILICSLMVKPIIGVADNGDFGRIMGSTGLKYASDDIKDMYFEYVTREFEIDKYDKLKGGYFSTEIALVEFAKIINSLFTAKSGIFDIRFLGMVYSAIFLLSLFLIMKYSSYYPFLTGLFFCILLLIVFTDAAYISYFNSLYGEAVSFSFLLLTAGIFLYMVQKNTPNIYLLILFFISAIFLSGAKAQNAPIGIIIAVFSMRLLSLGRTRLWKTVIGISALLLVSTSIISYSIIPERIKICNKYQAVFYGILKDSPAPGNDLEELGIARDLAVLAGTNYFMKSYPLDIKDPEFQAEINEKVNPLKVTMFYLTHPERFLYKLQNASDSGFQIASGLGNVEKTGSTEYSLAAESPGAWSRFKLEIVPHSLLFVFLFFLIYFIVLFNKWLRETSRYRRLQIELFMLIEIIGITQFVIPIIGDGEADIGKHLFMFNVCFDVMFVSSSVWLFHIFSTSVRKVISWLRVVYDNA